MYLFGPDLAPYFRCAVLSDTLNSGIHIAGTHPPGMPFFIITGIMTLTSLLDTEACDICCVLYMKNLAPYMYRQIHAGDS